jgi:hypothetical protein
MRLMKRSIPVVLLSLGYLGAAHGQQAAPATAINATAINTYRANIDRVLPEYNRSIEILATGLQQNWTRDRFAGKHLTACALPIQLPRTIWDERMPFIVQVSRLLDQCRQERDVLIGYRDLFLSTVKNQK